MLSHKQILKVAKFNAQYGEPEQTFSPSWHAENPVAAHDIAAVRSETRGGAERTISLRLRYVELASGDVTVWNDQGQQLPEGSRFVD